MESAIAAVHAQPEGEAKQAAIRAARGEIAVLRSRYEEQMATADDPVEAADLYVSIEGLAAEDDALFALTREKLPLGMGVMFAPTPPPGRTPETVRRSIAEASQPAGVASPEAGAALAESLRKAGVAARGELPHTSPTMTEVALAEEAHDASARALAMQEALRSQLRRIGGSQPRE